MDEPEVLRSTRRLVLLDASDEYRLIDRTVGEDPVETFPATAEGFDEAWDRFSRLAKEDRLGAGYPWLWWAVAGGTALWVVAGVVTTAWLLRDFGRGDVSRVFEIAAVLSDIGSKVALGGLVLLTALFLRRSLAQNAPERSPIRGNPSLSEVALRWLLALGLLAWIVGMVGDLFFPPNPLLSGGGIIRLEQERSLVWIAVDSLGFRVWVGSFVLLIVLWASRWWGFEEDSPSSPGT